jgi:double-stranded uracil-DNA glycosylase
MGFSRAELEAARNKNVPDLIGPETRLLFVGINPGLWTAAAQAHFARPGNRFYPALFRGGIVDRLIDASSGYSDADRSHLLDRGLGITNLVARATARADELSRDELVAGALTLGALVERVGPAVVAILGITAYRAAFAAPNATGGEQTGTIGGSRLWVVPNPSGLNAHSSLDQLATAYREAAAAAGLV